MRARRTVPGSAAVLALGLSGLLLFFPGIALQAAIVQMRELEVEDHDLRELLGLRRRSQLGSLLSVDVIARDPLGPVQALTVDRGTDDGMRPNLPVITWKGLVGRVVEVHPTS